MSTSCQKDYFVSYCTVTGSKANPFAHTYLVISELDHSKGKDARLEVTEAVGLYGDPYEPNQTYLKAIFPAKMFGPGHVKQEHLRHIVEHEFYRHNHKTWKISEQDKNKLLKSIESDRQTPLAKRNFAKEYQEGKQLSKWRRSKNPLDQKKVTEFAQKEENGIRAVKGLYFNAVNYSCMTDALRRLREINIDTSAMGGTLIDLPNLNSGPLDKMVLEYDEKSSKVYWKSPLTLTPNSYNLETAQQLSFVNYRVFAFILDNVDATYKQFDEKYSELKSSKLTCEPIVTARQALLDLKKQLATQSKYPNKIDSASNKKFEKSFYSILNKCQNDLKANNHAPELLQFMQDVLDVISTKLRAIRKYLFKFHIEFPISEFGVTKNAVNKANEMSKQIRNMTKVR